MAAEKLLQSVIRIKCTNISVMQRDTLLSRMPEDALLEKKSPKKCHTVEKYAFGLVMNVSGA